MKRCQLLINTKSLIYNYNYLLQCKNNKPKVIAVLKANAYGLGSVEIAIILKDLKNLSAFAVASLEEAEVLLSQKIPILVLGGCNTKEDFRYAQRYIFWCRSKNSCSFF